LYYIYGFDLDIGIAFENLIFLPRFGLSHIWLNQIVSALMHLKSISSITFYLSVKVWV
jgi:hypothetical protein